MKKTISPLLLIGLACTCSGQDSVSPFNTRTDSLQRLLDAQSAGGQLQGHPLQELAGLCIYDLQFERDLVAVRFTHQISSTLRQSLLHVCLY